MRTGTQGLTGAHGELVPAQPEAPRSSPLGDVAARFEALREHPHVAELLRHVPAEAARATGLGRLAPLVALALVAVAGIAVTLAFAVFCAPLALLPLTILVLCLFGMAKQLTVRSAEDGPLARHLALVVEGRSEISSGPDLQEATDHTTLELEDGSRHEVPTLRDVATEIAPGDIGVAFLRGGTLVEFGRVSV